MKIMIAKKIIIDISKPKKELIDMKVIIMTMIMIMIKMIKKMKHKKE